LSISDVKDRKHFVSEVSNFKGTISGEFI